MTQDSTTGTNAHVYAFGYDSNGNRLTSTESGALSTTTYDPANRLLLSISGSAVTTYSYDPNGNLIGALEFGGALTTMSYDKENRLAVHQNDVVITTYSYGGEGKKRTETVGCAVTTILWDGEDYLQSRA